MESVENHANLTHKSVENNVKTPTVVKGYQAKKYDATIRPFKNLSINRHLLALHELLTPAEFFGMVRLWDWFQSPEVDDQSLKFVTSRSHLAQISGLSETTAMHTLQTLKRLKVIKTVSTSFGVSNYVWNCGLLKWGVSEFYSGGEWKTSGPWVKITRPLSRNHPASIICTLLIPSIIPFYTMSSGHSNVDNSKPVMQDEGDINDALRAGFSEETINDALRAGLPVKNVVGLADGILKNWIYSGGEFWLYDIVPIIQAGYINLYTSSDVQDDLLEALTNKAKVSRSKNKVPRNFHDDDALFEHFITLQEAFNE